MPLWFIAVVAPINAQTNETGVAWWHRLRHHIPTAWRIFLYLSYIPRNDHFPTSLSASQEPNDEQVLQHRHSVHVPTCWFQRVRCVFCLPATIPVKPRHSATIFTPPWRIFAALDWLNVRKKLGWNHKRPVSQKLQVCQKKPRFSRNTRKLHVRKSVPPFIWWNNRGWRFLHQGTKEKWGKTTDNATKV